MDLAVSTLPAITGTATFSGVRNTTFPLILDTSTALSQTGIFTYSSIRPVLSGVGNTTFPLTLDTSTALSQTGIFTYSAIRPKLTDVVSQKVNTSSGSSAPSTRQILIQ